MNTEQKVDVILRHLKLRFELNNIIDKKNKAVREQDFATAVTLREEEVAIAAKLTENGETLCTLLNNVQNDAVSDITGSASSNEADNQINQTK